MYTYLTFMDQPPQWRLLPSLRLFDGFEKTSPQLSSVVLGAQKLLRAAGQTVKLDGLFGKDTEAAVRAYQESVSLKQDGVIGPRTWAALYGQPAVRNSERCNTPTRLGFVDIHFQTNISPSHSAHLRIEREAEKYRPMIKEIADAVGLPCALVAAIGSRESQWGLLLTPEGPAGKGDHGHGRGLLQIDDRFHEFAKSGNWQDPHENISYGINLLASYADRLRTYYENMGLLKAAVAAYNCGTSNVKQATMNAHDVDFYTTGRDYSKDVLNRAGWFQLRGW